VFFHLYDSAENIFSWFIVPFSLWKIPFFCMFFTFSESLPVRKLSLPINSECAASSEVRADASPLSHSAVDHSMNRRNISKDQVPKKLDMF